MAENRNLGKNQPQTSGKQNENLGLGQKEESLQRRGDRKEMEKTGNKTTGTPGSKEQDDVNLERGSSKGARENTGTTTRKDQEEGSSAGRSGSLGKEEHQREGQPRKGNR